MNQLGMFEYAGRIRIYWTKSGNIHTVTRHEQLDYEELCFENTLPTAEFMTTDPVDARKAFVELVQEFVN